MIHLNAIEARVIGVLIEKQTTTPEQYPLTLNALVNGCNQKSNRDPVLEVSDDEVHDALASLREKQLVVRVDQVGSRVPKFKHQAGETLHARARELAILAELLMRGPQTLGELRARASRMTPFATTDEVTEMLRALTDRPEPMVRQLPPMPGSRAERYAQLLCPEAHPTDASADSDGGSLPSQHRAPLPSRIDELERKIDSLTRALRSLALKVGEPDPFEDIQDTTSLERVE